MGINELVDITDQVVVVDGEEMYIIENDMYSSQQKLKDYISKKGRSAVSDILNYNLQFICNHIDFAIAFKPIKRVVKRIKVIDWFPCLLYRHERIWRGDLIY